MAPSDDKLSDSASAAKGVSGHTATASSQWGLRRSLFVLLSALMVLVVWSIGAEYLVLTTAKSSFLSLIHSASDIEEGDKAGGQQFYPDGVFETDWSTQIPDAELLHVSALHTACVKNKNAVIPWNFGIETIAAASTHVNKTAHSKQDADAATNPESVLIFESDPDLLDKLRQCPDIDVFISKDIRSFGYCEDAAVYTKCTIYSLKCLSIFT